MPRPKRAKLDPTQPASRRVAQQTLAESAASERRNLAREASGRTEDNSDDSDGLVTSFFRQQKPQAQLNEGAVMMRGGLGFGDVKGAHIRAGPKSGLTENVGYAGAMERLKARRDAALNAQKEMKRGRTDEEMTPGDSIDSADEGAKSAKDTPGIESSVLVISNFKRRTRQPSILRSAVESLQNDEDEDAFEPEDESTPLKFSTPTSIIPQGPGYASSSPLSLPGSNPRKRKLTPREEVPRSSPPVVFDLFTAESWREYASSSSSFLEAKDRHTEDGSRGGHEPDTNSRTLSETVAPPRSSSPAIQNAGVSLDFHSNPREQGANKRITKRQRKRLSQKTQVRQAGQVGESDVEDLESDHDGSADITILTGKFRRKDIRKRETPISTAALQNLLPRRRRRALPSEFDIMESSDIDSEIIRPNSYQHEPPIVSFKKDAKSRRSNSHGNRLGLGKAGSQGKKTVPLKKRVTATPVIKASRTYGRWTSSDKENDGLSSSPVEKGDSLAPVDSNEDTASQENSKQAKRILKQVARKFKDVDNWELDFEEVTASSSSPLGAR